MSNGVVIFDSFDSVVLENENDGKENDIGDDD